MNHNDTQAASVMISQAFDVAGTLEALPGGEGRTYRAGDAVYRREADASEAAYLADVYSGLPQTGFRVPQPVPTKQGAWVSPGGWSAWSFVDGSAATSADLGSVINAVGAFHRALARQPYPSYLAHRDTPFDRADRAAWGELPRDIGPGPGALVAQLSELREPVASHDAQLIHGDLNEENILVARGKAPAIIDFTPYWHPPAFALAILAYWLGPYRGDAAVLAAFEQVPNFDQMLVRAALRTLLVTHEFNGAGVSSDAIREFETPVRIVVAWVERHRHSS